MEESGRARVVPHDDTPDAAIVRAVRAGDRDAFTALFRAYYEKLVTFARATTRSDESAEEVVDDVFLRLWAHHDTWAPQGAVGTYLYRAVRNQAINAAVARTAVARTLERAIRYSEDATHPVAMGTSAGMPDERLAAREHQAVIRAAIAALGDQARMLMVLRWDQGMSWSDVAAVLGLSVEAAQMKHTRILRTLRRTLARYFE